jgi:hypothetical protein
MQCAQRNLVSAYLAGGDVATSVYFKPLSEMTYSKKAVKRPLPVTNRVWKTLLTLPVHDGLTWRQVEHIAESVQLFYRESLDVTGDSKTSLKESSSAMSVEPAGPWRRIALVLRADYL